MARNHLILCSALLTAPAFGQTVGLHVASVHDGSGFNNFNPGVYVRLENGATFGAYRNSYRKTSVYAGYTAETKGQLSAALTVGFVSGYERNKILFAPSAAYRFNEFSVRIATVPTIKQLGIAGFVHLMLERHF